MGKEGSAILGRIKLSDIKKKFGKEETVEIADYLDQELVTFLEGTTQAEAIESLVNLLDAKGKLQDKKQFLHAILEREKIISTGIGIGVAIPHAKLKGYEEFFIAVGIQKQGIEWDALDGLPVRVIFMIGGPEDQQTEYLNILSMLTGAIKEESRRKALLAATDAESVIALFQNL